MNFKSMAAWRETREMADGLICPLCGREERAAVFGQYSATKNQLFFWPNLMVKDGRLSGSEVPGRPMNGISAVGY